MAFSSHLPLGKIPKDLSPVQHLPMDFHIKTHRNKMPTRTEDRMCFLCKCRVLSKFQPGRLRGPPFGTTMFYRPQHRRGTACPSRRPPQASRSLLASAAHRWRRCTVRIREIAGPAHEKLSIKPEVRVGEGGGGGGWAGCGWRGGMTVNESGLERMRQGDRKNRDGHAIGK
jgi:hypothetical protein